MMALLTTSSLLVSLTQAALTDCSFVPIGQLPNYFDTAINRCFPNGNCCLYNTMCKSNCCHEANFKCGGPERGSCTKFDSPEHDLINKCPVVMVEVGELDSSNYLILLGIVLLSGCIYN